MQWFMEALRKYADFSGRSRRKEYWFFVLFYLIIYLVLAIVDTVILGSEGIGLLTTLFALAMLIPGIAVSVRRLHDTGRSGWWILIGFIPFIGLIVLLVFYFQDSQPGSNEYGPNPKGA